MNRLLTAILLAVGLVAAFLLDKSGNTFTGPETGNHEGMEIPAVPDEGTVIRHTGYTLAYNTVTNCPQWVAWALTREETETKAVSRTDNFKADPELPYINQVEGNDYRNSGYDRGHMCPAADMKWSQQAMSDCFYMSNICPQVPQLNQNWWEHLESACRRWAAQEGEIFICCGPVYHKNKQKNYIGNEHQIRVPDAFFKVVLSLQPNQEKAIAFIYQNTAERQTMEDAVVTVDQAEALTGYDFFPALDDELETQLEASSNLRAWN